MTSGVPSAGSEDAPCSAGEDASVPVGHTLERMNALLVLALTCTAVIGMNVKFAGEDTQDPPE